MQVRNIEVRANKPPISFDIEEKGCFVICSKQDDETSLLLRKLYGLDVLGNSESVIHDQSDTSVKVKEFGYFFKRGLLLSNLTLAENIALPYRYFCPECNWADYESRINWWMDFFKMDIDLSNRPANVNHSLQKLVAYLRNLILEPDICFIDDPYFQLSYVFRKKLVDCLRFLKEHNKILIIGTSDLDLIELFADNVVIMEKGEIIGKYQFSNDKRDASIQAVREYLDE